MNTEKLYKKHLGESYTLRNIEDINNIYGTDITMLKSYHKLTEHDKDYFNDFIVRFYNMKGLEARKDFIPTKIDFFHEKGNT